MVQTGSREPNGQLAGHLAKRKEGPTWFGGMYPAQVSTWESPHFILCHMPLPTPIAPHGRPYARIRT
eukprot:gene8324-biopygen19629